MKDFLSEQEIERAVRYLATSAEEYALAKSNMKYLDDKKKTTLAVVTMRMTGKSNAENKTRAEASEEFRKVVDESRDAVRAFTLIDAKRDAAETWVDTWRTQESSKRRGHV